MSKVGVKISIIVLEVIVALFIVSLALRIVHNPSRSNRQQDTAAINDSVIAPLYNTHSLQINVLNATNVSGIADDAKEWLQRHGFDVVEIGNASTQSEKSYIIDCIGNLRVAKATAKAVGISDSLIKKQIDPNHLICLSIVLGYDYKSLKPFKQTNQINIK